MARLVAELRRAGDGGSGSATGRTQGGVVLPDKAAVPTARQAAALLLKPKEKLTADQEAYLDRLGTLDEASAGAYRLAQGFARMVRGLEGEKLDEWLREADACEAAVMVRFAKGLRKDLSAMRAGLTERWSNGPAFAGGQPKAQPRPAPDRHLPGTPRHRRTSLLPAQARRGQVPEGGAQVPQAANLRRGLQATTDAPDIGTLLNMER